MNLMSSTLLTEDTGVPFDQLQAEQILRFRDALGRRRPRATSRAVSVSRSVIPITSDEDRAYFGRRGAARTATRSASSTTRSRASAARTPASRT